MEPLQFVVIPLTIEQQEEVKEQGWTKIVKRNVDGTEQTIIADFRLKRESRAVQSIILEELSNALAPPLRGA